MRKIGILGRVKDVRSRRWLNDSQSTALSTTDFLSMEQIYIISGGDKNREDRDLLDDQERHLCMCGAGSALTMKKAVDFKSHFILAFVRSTGNQF